MKPVQQAYWPNGLHDISPHVPFTGLVAFFGEWFIQHDFIHVVVCSLGLTNDKAG
jgi:hypothetical protein